MDEFGVLTERYGLKSHGKSAPMAASKRSNNSSSGQTWNFASNSTYPTKSAYESNSADGSLLGNLESPFSNSKSQNLGGLSDGFDIFGGFQTSSKQSNKSSNGASFDYDSIFSNSSFSSAKSSFDDGIFGGLASGSFNNKDDIFGSFGSKPPKQSPPTDDLLGNFGSKSKGLSQGGSVGFDDLIPGFGLISTSRKGENNGTVESTFPSAEDPFVILESTSTTTKSTFIDPLEEFSKLSNSKSTKIAGSSNVSPLLRPPPKPGQVLKTEKVGSSGVSPVDELEDFATGSVQSKADGHSDVHHAREGGGRQSTKSSKYKEAEDAARQTHHSVADDLESFFGVASRSTSVPKARPKALDPVFDATINSKGKPETVLRKSSVASSSIKKASSTANLADDLFKIFGDSPFSGEFEEVKGETEERRRARLERHQRTQNRVAKAVADMNQRDLQSQYEQEERHMIAAQMDVEIRRWATGKEGNMRALLSSLQHVLWPECGWEPISLTDLITSSSVKKVYRKATLCVHPDKVQQKGATLQQKYVAEKVFDILKEAWNKFNKEELS